MAVTCTNCSTENCPNVISHSNDAERVLADIACSLRKLNKLIFIKFVSESKVYQERIEWP